MIIDSNTLFLQADMYIQVTDDNDIVPYFLSNFYTETISEGKDEEHSLNIVLYRLTFLFNKIFANNWGNSYIFECTLACNFCIFSQN